MAANLLATLQPQQIYPALFKGWERRLKRISIHLISLATYLTYQVGFWKMMARHPQKMPC